MRVLVCGDRNWADYQMILDNLRTYQAMAEVVIEGDAPGADRMAGRAADELGIQKLVFPAKWRLLKSAAGPIRNQQMLVEGKPTLVLAFHDNIRNSKGTKDMIGRARKAGLPVVLFSHGEKPMNYG